jgi:hypothetical protein
MLGVGRIRMRTRELKCSSCNGVIHVKTKKWIYRAEKRGAIKMAAINLAKYRRTQYRR